MDAIYNDLKLFHFQDKLDSLPPERPISAPLHVRFKPTNKCNHRCRYCIYRDSALQLGKHMDVRDELSREKFLEICRDLVDMGVRAVTFSGGGEPLLHPNILEAARILVDGGVKLATLTNGSLLAGEVAAFFSAKATWVRISMDGWDDASYARYRSVRPGAFTQLLHNIEAFLRLGGPCALSVVYNVDAENWPHIPEVLDRLRDVGVRSVKVSALVVSDDSAQERAYHALHAARVAEMLQAYAGIPDFEVHNAITDVAALFDKEYTWCPYMQVKTVIGADAGVYACHNKAYNRDCGLLGSLRRQGFATFWRGAKPNMLGINPARDCRHHCVANKRNLMLLQYLGTQHTEFV